MRIRLLCIIMALFLFGSNCSAQNDDVTFLIGKIKSTYAGYYDKAKGSQFDKYVRMVLKSERNDTFQILSKIANYFDDQHLKIYAVNALKYITIDSTKARSNLDNLKQYFFDRGVKEKYEGFWINDQETSIIAIRKKKGQQSNFEIYLIESRSNKIPPGFLIGNIQETKKNQFYSTLLAPGSGNQFVVKSKFRNDSILIMGDLARWRKLINGDKLPTFITAGPITVQTSGVQIDSDNYLLTLPSFTLPNKYKIDSIIQADYSKIISSKNLIIDIRNNAGGTVSCYAGLTPFIYTNPIKTTSGYTRCSKDLIEHTQESLDKVLKRNEKDSSIIKQLQQNLKNFKENQGKFYFESGDIIKLDSIMKNPQNVAIITNYGCESAAEMMVMDFKQSTKTTTFGEATFGAIDYLNTFPIELPSKKYILTLATVKRYIPKGQKPLDNIGIYPDVPIGDSISDWIEFTRKYYANKQKDRG